MARAATTTDAFNAVAEPRRRQILDVLAGPAGPAGAQRRREGRERREERQAGAQRELSVNQLVARLGLAQPQVSKHLRVLREVGLVAAREEGRQRMYRLNGQALRPIHDWVKAYERSWNERFDALDEVLQELQSEELRGKKEEGNGGGGE